MTAGNREQSAQILAPTPGLLSACDCGCASAPSRPKARRHLSLLPTVLLVLMPKCPLCLAAWIGIFGSFGTNRWVNAVWGMPLALVLLSMTLGALALRAWRSRDPRPAFIGVMGAASLLSGKFLTDTPICIYLGLALLIGASLLSTRVAASRNVTA